MNHTTLPRPKEAVKFQLETVSALLLEIANLASQIQAQNTSAAQGVQFAGGIRNLAARINIEIDLLRNEISN
jgi:hypothetical protein